VDAQECEQGVLKTELRHDSRCKKSRLVPWFGPGENQRSSSRCSLFVRALLELEADGERGVTDALLTESKLLSGRNRFCYRIPILNQSFTKKRWRVLGCAQFFSCLAIRVFWPGASRPALAERPLRRMRRGVRAPWRMRTCLSN
jgi:hypothetical protein